MKSFLTGSQVYGTPTAESDIDLVVLVEGNDLYLLEQFATNKDEFGAPGGVEYEDGLSLRFGKLNLLCVTKDKHFNVWRQGTEELKSRKPVTRDEAIAFLADLRRKEKIQGW